MKVLIVIAFFVAAALAIEFEPRFSNDLQSVQTQLGKSRSGIRTQPGPEGLTGVESYAGEPNCLRPQNWGRTFPHYWYHHMYWICYGPVLWLNCCDVPYLYQPSLECCVPPSQWWHEPRPTPPPKTTTPAPTTAAPTTVAPTTAAPTTVAPPTESICSEPRCDGHWWFVLQPTHSPVHFWQCTPYGHALMPCAPGTKFGFKEQVCVWPADHVDHC